MDIYRLTAGGRRTALILLISALIIWAFALWTFRTTLGTSSDPNLGVIDAFRQNLSEGLTISQIVPALLMLVLIVATPLVVWNILEEWGASYTITDDSLLFESLGIRVAYPWSGIQTIAAQEDDGDEPFDALQLDADYTVQITNPLLRLLHRQAFGARRLPLYAGIERRQELIATIQARMTTTEPAEVGYR